MNSNLCECAEGFRWSNDTCGKGYFINFFKKKKYYKFFYHRFEKIVNLKDYDEVCTQDLECISKDKYLICAPFKFGEMKCL